MADVEKREDLGSNRRQEKSPETAEAAAEGCELRWTQGLGVKRKSHLVSSVLKSQI